MKVRTSKFRMLNSLNKTLDQFEDEPSETFLRALKTFTLKKPVNIITLQGLRKQFQYLDC